MSPDTSSLRIALVDDQELWLESLGALFGGTEGAVEVLWSARSGEEALVRVREQQPDVVVMDYSFKNNALDGAEATRLLLEEYPHVAVLLLSVSCELPVIREALQKGALGYVSKEVSKADLLRAIRTVARGEYFLDQTAQRAVIRWLIKKLPKTVLTRRELEVAQPYAKGLPIRDIGAALFISEDTVDSHIKSIRSKTGAGSRYEVAEYLKGHDLLDE